MSIKKSKYSVAVINKKGNVIGYLSTRDEENGLDVVLDLQGYTIVALWQQKKGGTEMDKQELYEILENMTAQLGADVLLKHGYGYELWRFKRKFGTYIDRMHDLENFWSTIAVNGIDGSKLRHTALNIIK